MLFGLAAALLAAVPAIADPSQIQQKQAEAQSVLAQINALDARLGTAVERYNYANVKLQKIHAQLRENTHELYVAQSNLKLGQQHIVQRVVDLYTNGDNGGTMEVILGAKSLDDLLNRLDTVNRDTNLDAKVVREVRTFKAATKRHAKLLREARAAQVKVVAQRAAQKRSIEAQLSRERTLRASIQGEIARMQAAEAARQAILRRQAEARIAAARIAARSTGSTSVGVPADAGGATSGDTGAAPPPSQYGGVVGIAMSQLGKPYVWAAAGPDSFDCSGLVVWSFAQIGVSLPHSSYALAGMGTPVSRDQLEPGDLVFFDGDGHVGIYIGGGQFVHAPQTGDVVKISSLDGSGLSYDGARRIG